MNTLLEQLKEYFNNTQPTVVKKEWEDLDMYNSTGITINKFLFLIEDECFSLDSILEKKARIEKTPEFSPEFFYFCTTI